MTQSVLVGKDTIILNSDTVYTGMENPQNDEKLVRKAVGLPVKKQLIYYKNTHDSESSVSLITFIPSAISHNTPTPYSERHSSESSSITSSTRSSSFAPGFSRSLIFFICRSAAKNIDMDGSRNSSAPFPNFRRPRATEKDYGSTG